MNDKIKLLLILAVIIIAGGYSISFLKSSRESADFPDGGTWAKCNACQEMQLVDPDARGKFYDENPNMQGRPMLCPKCNKGTLIDGLKCPLKGCFYIQAQQKKDGTPICPVCKSDLP